MIFKLLEQVVPLLGEGPVAIVVGSDGGILEVVAVGEVFELVGQKAVIVLHLVDALVGQVHTTLFEFA